MRLDFLINNVMLRIPHNKDKYHIWTVTKCWQHSREVMLQVPKPFGAKDLAGMVK